VADLAFVAELLFAYNAGTSALLPSKTLSVHFESLNMLGNKYGLQSQQYKASVFLVDHILHFLASKNSHQFNEFVVFFLSTPASQQNPTLNAVGTVGDLVHHLPHIYVKQPLHQLQSDQHDFDKISTMCQHIRSSLKPEDQDKVVCRGEIRFYQKRAELQTPSPPSPPPGPSPAPQTDSVAQFQVILWAAVFLIVVLGAAISVCLAWVIMHPMI